MSHRELRKRVALWKVFELHQTFSLCADILHSLALHLQKVRALYWRLKFVDDFRTTFSLCDTWRPPEFPIISESLNNVENI